MAYDDVETELDPDFDSFRDQLVEHLECKWEKSEVEWLEPAYVCRPYNA